MKKNKNAIFITFDDTYFSFFKACINSIKKNYPNYPELLVCYTGKRQYVFDFLSSISRLRLIRTVSLSDKYSLNEPGEVKSLLIYQRYRLWSTEFSEYGNILHLDADTLILKPLNHLFDLKTFFILKNNNGKIFWEEFRRNKSLKKILKEDGLDYPEKLEDLLNAGVFMITSKMRRTKRQ